jgi:restriction endonuclease NotI
LALRIVEFFGYGPLDSSEEVARARKARYCPFVQDACTKKLRDGSASGACTVKQSESGPVICCPNRLYAGNYQILVDVAEIAFGKPANLIPGEQVAQAKHDGRFVAVFGKRWGKELRLPQRKGTGAYFVDWILALIGADGKLQEFVALEVQAIDTTGNYRAERDAYLNSAEFAGSSKAGLNWENVSKRILPQIIYKGHVLRQEELCKKGIFFVCPTPVYKRIQQRLGGTLRPYSLQPGALTFKWYDIGPGVGPGALRALEHGGQFTTTIDQVAHAFTEPADLPPAGVYQQAIETELKALRR